MQSFATLLILNIQEGYYCIYTPPFHSSFVPRRIGVMSPVTRNEKNGLKEIFGIVAKTLYGNASDPNESREFLLHCQQLYRQILPVPIQNELKKLEETVPLVIISNDTRFPWELMHDGIDFLALRRPVSRCFLPDSLPNSKSPVKQERYAALIIANPTEDLPKTETEAEHLGELFFSQSLPVDVKILARNRATITQVKTALSQKKYQIIHYAGHAQPGALLLNDGILSGKAIEDMLAGNPFVFLNGCQSVEQPDEEMNAGILDSLANSFLAGGASGVVGTVWKVEEEPALKFAKEFYEQILSGRSVSESLMKTRLSLRQQHPGGNIWAAYSGYGTLMQTILAPPFVRRNAAVVSVRLLENIVLNIERQPIELSRLIEQIVQSIDEFGGSVQSVTATHITAYFHNPQQPNMDVKRALWAALDIRKKIVSAETNRTKKNDLIFQAGIGIGAGEVSFPTEESFVNSTPAVMSGEPVQTALRLADLSAPGEILVAEKTANLLAEDTFKFQARAENYEAVAGNEIYALVSARMMAHHRLRSTPSIPITGRGYELARLQQLSEETIAGQKGHIVWVVGKPGIGKSRLIEEFQSTISTKFDGGIFVRSVPYAKENPYALLKQLTAALLFEYDEGRLADHRWVETLAGKSYSAGKLQILADIFSEAEPNPARRLYPETKEYQALNESHVAGAVRHLFEVAARRGKLLYVIFEDVHQADTTSITILEKAMPGLVRLPIFFVFVSRLNFQLPWLPSIDTEILRLNALPAPDMENLLNTILETGRVPREVSQSLIQKAEGNPFFLRELVSVLQERQSLVKQGNHWKLLSGDEFTLDTMEHIIESQINALPATKRQILQAAAVIGTSISAQNIITVLKQQDTLSAINNQLDKLEELDFLMPNDYERTSYEFVHPAKREIIYQRTPHAARRAYHRRFAEYLLDNNGDKPLIAQHLYSSLAREAATSNPANDAEVLRAVEHLIATAARSQQQYANREAVTAYRHTIELLKQYGVETSQIVDVYQNLGMAYSALGKFKKAFEAYSEAFGILRKGIMDAAARRQAADLARLIGRTKMWSSEFETALRWMDEGRHTLGQPKTREDTACLALLNIHTGAIYYLRGKFSKAQEFYRKGLELAEAANDIESLAEAYNGLGVILDVQGHSRDALKLYQQSYQFYEKTGNRYRLATVSDNIGTAKFYLGEWADISQWDPTPFWREIGDQNKIAYGAINLGMLALYRGEWQTAEQLFSEAIELSETVQNHRIVAVAYNNMGLLKLAQGDISGGEQYLKQSLDIFQMHNIEDRPAEVYCGLAEAAVLAKNAPQAIEYGNLALESARAEELLLEECVALRWIGVAHYLRGDDTAAEKFLKESLEIATKLEFVYEIGRTKLEIAKLYHAHRRDVEAKKHLTKAIDIFNRLDAAPMVAQTTALKEVLL